MFKHFGASIAAPHKSAEENEDYFLSKEYDDGSLLTAVADGVSASGGGRLAAREIVLMIHEVYNENRLTGRALLNAFAERLRAYSGISENTTKPQSTLAVVQFQHVQEINGVRASYFGIGDTTILLAQDKRLGEEYPKTFVCYRIFSRPQPFVDSRLFAYVDLASKEIVGRPIFGEFDLLPEDVCLIYSDGVRDEYIQRTVKREHKFLWDVKERGPECATSSFIESIQSDVGDDATIITVLVTAEEKLDPLRNLPALCAAGQQASLPGFTAEPNYSPGEMGGAIADKTGELAGVTDSEQQLSESNGATAGTHSETAEPDTAVSSSPDEPSPATSDDKAEEHTN